MPSRRKLPDRTGQLSECRETEQVGTGFAKVKRVGFGSEEQGNSGLGTAGRLHIVVRMTAFQTTEVREPPEQA